MGAAATSKPYVLHVLLFAILFGATLPLQAFDDDISAAKLTVCNKGTIPANLAVAVELNGLFTREIEVSGWKTIDAGKCKEVYNETGTQDQGASRAYLAFGIFNAHNRLISASVAQPPDFGNFPWGTKVLTQSDRQLCVSDEGMAYTVKNTALDCSTFHPQRGPAGPYFPFSAALLFYPIPQKCSKEGFNNDYSCFGGEYYLNIRPSPGDSELHASIGASNGEDQSPPPSVSDTLKALGDAMAQARLRQQQAQQQPTMQQTAQKQWDDQLAQSWKAPRYPAGSYNQSLVGKEVVVHGTVSRVTVRTDKVPHWVTIYFKESPGGEVVICSPDPRMIEVHFGSLTSLVGKTVEAAGEVESLYCNSGKTSVRVVDAQHLRIVSP